jgi:hypothetical protein
MPYPKWDFDIISPELVMSRDNEALCPIEPKITLVDAQSFDDAIESTWNQYRLREWKGVDDHTSGNAGNIQWLLCQVFPSERLCAYHLGRGMAAVALEVIGFPIFEQYVPLVAPMGDLIERVTIGAPTSYISHAREALRDFMEAEANNGTQGFADRYRATEPVRPKKVHWWQR